MPRLMPSGLFRQLALPFLCLCFAASCAPHMSRVISEEQSQLLDSLPLLTNAGPADWIQDIKTPTKGVNIKLSDGTTTKSQRLYVRWGEGSSFTKAIAFSPPENLPFNCQMAEAVGQLKSACTEDVRNARHTEQNLSMEEKLNVVLVLTTFEYYLIYS